MAHQHQQLQGKLITFEGGEGAGKSTQIRRLSEHLQQRGLQTVVTREPGGSAGAEMVREVLLSGAAREHGPMVEALLFAAARTDHIDELIRPAMQAGKWVLCDRFADSSRVYQGEAGVASNTIERLQDVALDGIKPHTTVLIDVPAEVGLRRVGSRAGQAPENAPDRFEQDSLATHRRRRDMFLAMAEAEPDRFVVIDGTMSPDQVASSIWQAMVQRYPYPLDEKVQKPSSNPASKRSTSRRVRSRRKS
ncbi:dTMP kinase [Polycladidibacter hongkongensis]|uniref:dTMP kinase n=1 Tax=Polycladidibacter hongkongensis TaxID=1647556 RepID=UPI001FCC43D3|nr:dTMP kinase [Pseudovibrio hongkongensis]